MTSSTREVRSQGMGFGEGDGESQACFVTVWNGVAFDVSPAFEGQSQDKKAKIRIDDAEFDSSDEFANEVNSITSHRIAIRFSTARFTEDYRWDDHGVEKAQNNPRHCEVYSQGKRFR